MSVPAPDALRPGGRPAAQLAFAAVASLALYGLFVLTQTVRLRSSFLAVAPDQGAAGDDDEEHAPTPSARAAWTSFGLLAVALVGVVGVAKVESPSIERAVADAGLPQAVVGHSSWASGPPE